MEEHLEQVLAATFKAVLKEQAFPDAIQQKTPFVYYRRFEAGVTRVFCQEVVELGLSAPCQDLGPGVVFHREQFGFDKPIHFHAIDASGIVAGRRPELISACRISGVDISSAVGDERRATTKELEAQAVIVRMPTIAAHHSDIRAGDKDVYLLSIT